MSDVLHWLDKERLTLLLECSPLILLGIAWLALRSRRGAHTFFRHEGSEERELKGRRPLPMPKTSGRAR